MYGEKGGYAIADDMESYCFGLHASATSKIGNTATSTTTGYASGETSPIETLAQAQRKLNVLNVPSQKRFGVFPPHFFEKLMDESGGAIKANEMGDSQSNLKNGFVKRLLGFDLYMSNNLTTGTGTSDGKTYYSCLLGTKDAIALAQQVTEKKMVDLESSFAKGMKLLNVYGAAVTRPDALCTAYLNFA